ncbi:hypothetical protein DVQ80_01505 [Yersinia enterocolitica]|nr:hypothetical protein [Yersinia enterocolitica]
MKELDRFTSQRLESLCDYRPNRVTNLINFREIAALARIALAAKRAEGLPGNIYPDISGEITALEKILKWILNLEVPTTGATNRAILLGNTIELLRDCQKPIVATPQLNSPEIPEGWPTEDMVIAGFESGAWDALSSAVLKRQGWPYSCRESAECVTGIFKAMLAAAPEKGNG